MELWTQSRARTFRRCRRLHFLRYEEGWRPVTSDQNLYTGTIWGLAMDAWWAPAEGPEQRLECALAAVAGKERTEDGQIRIEEMVRVYHDRWIDDMPLFEVVEIEAQFGVPLYNPATSAASRTWELGGKMDKLLRDVRTGQILIGEHKTTGDALGSDSDYFPKLAMDGQVNQYYCGALGMDLEPWGVLYDVVQKTKIRPKTINSGNVRREPYLEPIGEYEARNAQRKGVKDLKRKQRDGETDEEWAARAPRPETMDEYRERVRQWYRDHRETALVRRKFERTESQLLEFLRDAWQDSKACWESKLADSHPRNPDACNDWNRRCEFWDHCAYGADLSSDPRLAKSETKHPELEGV